MLISPMWDNEVERIGVQKCSPLSSWLRGMGDLMSLFAFLAVAIKLMIAKPWLSIYWWQILLLWMFGRVLYMMSLYVLKKRHFRYDAENLVATWCDAAGTEVCYTHKEYEQDAKR